ncbi:uncharacterized protein F4822DRAFT_444507 [Hypoxylon trugodes]|uniref:uncharacterized protein n=1 Tax=Hypoxylon trugodes TaxID=326681 RepID=UPI00219864CD|nr:uncharacterized protein F4822DRAFT_444507 [Hypoxylon trugodes]KAI1388051.1 hypothetical protein F4822DRAFT_444507 [Hypoxylon trugodes]
MNQHTDVAAPSNSSSVTTQSKSTTFKENDLLTSVSYKIIRYHGDLLSIKEDIAKNDAELAKCTDLADPNSSSRPANAGSDTMREALENKSVALRRQLRQVERQIATIQPIMRYLQIEATHPTSSFNVYLTREEVRVRKEVYRLVKHLKPNAASAVLFGVSKQLYEDSTENVAKPHATSTTVPAPTLTSSAIELLDEDIYD